MLRTVRGVLSLGTTRSYHSCTATQFTKSSIRAIYPSYPNYHRKNNDAGVAKTLNNPSQWRIAGMSVGGVATSLFLIEPKIMVDAGALLSNNDGKVIPSDLLVTHHHGDHNRNVGYYVEKGVRVFDPVSDHYHGLGGRTYNLTNRTTAYTFELDHTIKSVGYGISSKNGTKEVAIMGDTRIDPLYEIPEILDWPVIVIECTNYDPEPHRVQMYRKYGHLSWIEIKDIIQKNPDNYFHLIHPSSKLSVKQKRWIQENLIEGAGIRNAEIWEDRVE